MNSLQRILLNHFKRIELPLPFNEEKILGLGLDMVITMLCTHRLIDQPIYSDIISINQVRNNFIHSGLIQTIAKEDFRKVTQNIPKLKRTITKLERIYEQIKVIEIEDWQLT